MLMKAFEVSDGVEHGVGNKRRSYAVLPQTRFFLEVDVDFAIGFSLGAQNE
jgi:hypothetical protein